jgi:Glyoxalase/Bleomycin resistance protein/Dioxygenase superfamily
VTPAHHHIGYVVNDLRVGVEQFSATTGAGPFFAIEHLIFEEVTYRGGPAVYDHSSAFGQWGSIMVELTQVHDAQPAGLRDALSSPGAGIGHVGWLADSLEDEIARLQTNGLTVFHTGRIDPVSAVWLEGGDLFGHPIEVLQRRDELLGFYAMLRDASRDWDGSEPYRVLTEPPA